MTRNVRARPLESGQTRQRGVPAGLNDSDPQQLLTTWEQDQIRDFMAITRRSQHSRKRTRQWHGIPRRLLMPALALAIISLAAFLLYRTLSNYSVSQIETALRSIPLKRIGLMISFAAASYLCLTGFDWLALRYVRRAIPYPKVALASFCSLSLGHNVTSLVSHVPGGLGVIETVVLYLLPGANVIGALIAFRAIYFLLPLAIGAPLFGITELVLKHNKAAARKSVSLRSERVQRS